MERLPTFVLERPATLAQAVEALSRTEGARLIGGGTDLVPNLRDGLGAPPVLVDLAGVRGFAAIEFGGHGARVGAGATIVIHFVFGDQTKRFAAPDESPQPSEPIDRTGA